MTPFAALARALELAVADATDWAAVSLDELQRLGAPEPCEAGRIGRREGRALRRETARLVTWRYEPPAGSGADYHAARFAVRPWRGVRAGVAPTLRRRPPRRASTPTADRREMIRQAAERRGYRRATW